MADEAFALSPISARAALPSEADYDAIREAFMETSRGRWFLGEFAKRNRNADTSMVLDAVARIEETLAQRPQPATDDGLEEALAAIRGAVDQAGASISATLDGLGLAEKLAPIRKGARIVKEIEKTGKPVAGFSIERHGDLKTIEMASRKAKEFVQYATELQREPFPVKKLCMSTKWPSRVVRTSSSTQSLPRAMARSMAGRVFSGHSRCSPRWAIT